MSGRSVPRPRSGPVDLDIESLSHEGRGVARHDGKTVFVDNALPGELVSARIVRRHGRYDEAIAEHILRPSPERAIPGCEHFGVCGGCSLQHMTPAAQLEHKQRMLLEQLQHLGRVAPSKVLPPVTGPAWGYRRRARLGLRLVPKKGGVLVGFREKSGRYIADIRRCPVLRPEIGDNLLVIRDLIGALSCADQVPQIEVGVDDAGPVLTIRHLRPLTEADVGRLGDASREYGWRIYLQPGGVDSVRPLSAGQQPLSFAAPRHDVRLQHEPLDFIQINGAVNLAVIDAVVALLELRPDDRVLDLFCGLGNFTLPIARRIAWAIGVEGEAGLVTRARANAERNGIHNAEFLAADLTTARPPQRAYNKVVLDPPRTGAIEILRRMETREVAIVVYVSCSPATLARDAGVLVREHGFRLAKAGVMDMFPHTAHVESLALFVR
ncbi:MAG: 23S rRNA (uracil(1939)-C(5))-methyltransferase RlmD [Gammaproteobacteria bacterium]|nr:23S rRNA (uracil(1939)-C(5))-methyltransferase RlmD [Gammaproteobacteria bacterium]